MPLLDVDLLVLVIYLFLFLFLFALGERIAAFFHIIAGLTGVLFAWETFRVTSSIPLSMLLFGVSLLIFIRGASISLEDIRKGK